MALCLWERWFSFPPCNSVQHVQQCNALSGVARQLGRGARREVLGIEHFHPAALVASRLIPWRGSVAHLCLPGGGRFPLASVLTAPQDPVWFDMSKSKPGRGPPGCRTSTRTKRLLRPALRGATVQPWIARAPRAACLPVLTRTGSQWRPAQRTFGRRGPASRRILSWPFWKNGHRRSCCRRRTTAPTSSSFISVPLRLCERWFTFSSLHTFGGASF